MALAKQKNVTYRQAMEALKGKDYEKWYAEHKGKGGKLKKKTSSKKAKKSL